MTTRHAAEPLLASTTTTTDPGIAAAAVAGGIAAPRLLRRRRAVATTVDVAGEEESARAGSWVGIVLVAGLILAFLLRLAASEQLSSHVDESASVLAVQMVAEKGAPIFPSGTLYLQGATISYLLAPVALLGYGDLDHLNTMRLLSVVAGTAAVAALFLFARHVTGSAAAGVLAALFLAFDPVSVRWGGLVRMYALLQLVTILMLLCFLILLRRPASRRVWVGFIALFWFGVFTHIAICMFLVPMGSIALWKHRSNLLDGRRDLTAALAAAGAAPFALLGLNQLVTPPDSAVSDAVPGVSFVGDYLLSFGQIFHPNFTSWHLLFRYSSFGDALPTIIIAMTCLLVGRYVFGMPGAAAEIRERRNMLGVLLALYWVPILLVAAFATEANERYLLHLHPLGLALVVLGVHDLASQYVTAPRVGFAPADRRRRAIPEFAGGLAGGAFGGVVAADDDARPRVELAWLTAARVYTAAVAGLLTIGAGLRVYNLDRLSLWLDEGFSLLYASQPWGRVAGLDGFYSPHPTGYFLLTKVALLALPEPLAGRSISVACGVLTLPVFFLLARKILDRTGALVATGVLALSPIHLYYTQEARMYALVVLLVALSYLLLVTFIETRAARWAVLYGLTLALGVYADYSAAYALAPQAVIILIALIRWGRRAVPLVVAGAVAVLAYVPWLPQVLDSINAANDVDRRETYLGVDLSRVLTLVMHLTGFGSDAGNAYFTSTRETAWDRWPIVRPLLVLVIGVILVLGYRGMRVRWQTTLVTGGLIATILVAIWISLISPGFAERTILSAVLGWALLIGAMFNGRTTRLVRAMASGSVAVVILVSLLTIQTYQTSAVKQRWTDASADLALLEPLGFPVVTYGYGAVTDVLVNAYEPGLLDRMRVVTVRDGELEKVLSNDILPKPGITLNDVRAGRFAEMFPETPENDFVFYLYYQRAGSSEIGDGIVRQDYTRVLANVYDSPRWRVYLDLYARPGANLGDAVTGIEAFTDQVAWNIPESAAGLFRVSSDGSGVAISNQSTLGTALTTQLPGAGAAIYTLRLNASTPTNGLNGQVAIQCLSVAGTSLQEALAPRFKSQTAPQSSTFSVLCPAETVNVQVVLRNVGIGEVVFDDLSLRRLPIPARPSGSA